MPAHVRRSAGVGALVLPWLILIAPPARGAEWTPIGPDGGTVYALELQPGSSSVLYAGTAGGVFKSVDGGANWSLASQGLPMAIVLDVAIDPASPATVYAAVGFHGVYRSSDGGAHWSYVGRGLERPPSSSSVYGLTVGTGGTVYAGTDLGVVRSRDGGATWQTLNQGLPDFHHVNTVEIDPSRPKTLLAGLADRGIYRSTDGGASWWPAGGVPADAHVSEIHFGPAPFDTLYAASSGGVLRSLDRGVTWQPVSPGLPSFVAAVAVHPTSAQTVYAGVSIGVFRSVDSGATWQHTSEGLPGGVWALAIDPARPHTLWAGSEGFTGLGGVSQTTDAGAHWTFRSRGLSALTPSALAVDPHHRGTLFAALAHGGGLARSRDYGLNWSLLPVPDGVFSIWDVEVDPVDPSTVYALGATSGSLLKSTDGGDSWVRLATTTPVFLLELEIDPRNPAVFHAGGYDGFYNSTDGGLTWVHSSFEPYVTPIQIEIAPGVLYAIVKRPIGPGSSGVNRTQLCRSRDGGQSWDVVIDILGDPRSVAVSPSDPLTVYAALLDGTISRSTDGGDSWQPMSRLAAAASSLAIAAGTPETLYAAVPSQGVLASTDGGATWSPVGEGLAATVLAKLVLDPRDPGRLYVTTSNRGIAALHQPDECLADATTLCLQGGRFHVQVTWADFQGNAGQGQTMPLTDESGAFWFFAAANVELVVKVLDGRAVNGKLWVFTASLTSVQFTLTVTDTETGKQKVYRNPSGTMASFGDTSAF